MLGVQNRDLRRASLISEIYSETAGPTGGNLEKLQNIAAQQQQQYEQKLRLPVKSVPGNNPIF